MKKIEPGIPIPECLNPAKEHLFNLPVYDGIKQPPKYDWYDICYFIPIYQTRPYDLTIEHHAVRSALWALNSYIENSDHENVMFRLYCEKQQKERIIHKLKEEGVNPDDWVIWFDGEPFEGDPQTHLGKTNAYMDDLRFCSFVWAVKGDTDLFALENCAIFSHVRNNCSPDHISITDGVVESPSNLKTNTHWTTWISPHCTKEQLLDIWVSKARKFVTPEIIRKLFIRYYRCSGAIHVFPVQTFWNEKNNERKLLIKISKEMQDDEVAFSLCHELGNEIQDIDFQSTHDIKNDRFPSNGLYHPSSWETDAGICDSWNKYQWYDRCRIIQHNRHWANRVIVEPKEPLPVAPAPENSETIVIMQLFQQDNLLTPEDVVSRCLTPALYAYRSWYYNTDMLEQNGTFKWYIEDKLEGYIRPVLERNGVDWDRDVWVWHRFYDYIGTGCETMALLDDRFKKYKRFVFANCDYFIMNGKVPIFEYLASHSDPVYSAAYKLDDKCIFEENTDYWDLLFYYNYRHVPEEERNEIKHELRLNELFDRPSKELCWYAGDFTSLPIHMSEEVQQYIHKFQKLIGNNEHTTIPLKELFGINIRSLQEDMGIPWVYRPEEDELPESLCFAHMIGRSKKQLEKLGIPTNEFKDL